VTPKEAGEWAKYLSAVSQKLSMYAEHELGWGHTERQGFAQGEAAAQRILLEARHDSTG